MKNDKKRWICIVVIVLGIAVSIWPLAFCVDIMSWPDYYANSAQQAEALFLEKLELLDDVLEPYDLQTAPYTKEVEDSYIYFDSVVYLDNGGNIWVTMKWQHNLEVYCWITLVGASSSTAETCVHDLDAYPYVYEMLSCLTNDHMSSKKFYRLAQEVQENAIEQLPQFPSMATDGDWFKYITVERGSVDYTIKQSEDIYRATLDFFLEM